ncbi:hypothetical protein SAMD00079811_80410 (plasmid) [Scytonema sp. HK-05]|nr:hypothetical protein SAMD00079811_80410 [Scytonema sp. HK-05]
MQSCTSCVRVVLGECFQTIFLSGKLCIITNDNGEKMEHGRKFTLGLRLWVRVSQNREASPSEAIMDSQSIETANFGITHKLVMTLAKRLRDVNAIY